VTTRPHLLSESVHDAEPVDEYAELRAELNTLRKRVEQLESRLGDGEEQVVRIFRGVAAVFSSDGSTPQPSVAGGTNPKWEALKKAFPGRCSELIDTLIAHGPLRTSQIAAIMRSDPRTVTQLIHKLNKAGGIEKNGGKFSLKP
jgi:hypothetical protein